MKHIYLMPVCILMEQPVKLTSEQIFVLTGCPTAPTYSLTLSPSAVLHIYRTRTLDEVFRIDLRDGRVYGNPRYAADTEALAGLYNALVPLLASLPHDLPAITALDTHLPFGTMMREMEGVGSNS